VTSHDRPAAEAVVPGAGGAIAVRARAGGRRRVRPWLLVAPSLAVMALTTLFPLAYSLAVSFTHTS